jgi:hypothetical protein
VIDRNSAFVCIMILGLAAGCSPPRRAPVAPCPPAAPMTDPRVLDGIARIEGSLRMAPAVEPAAGAGSDAFKDLAAQRLGLAQRQAETKRTIDALVLRIQRARKAARAWAESDSDRAVISETLLDLDEGKPLPKLPKRLGEREPIKDAAEAHALLTKAREQLKRLDGQIDAIDATLASAGPGPIVAAP